MSERTWVGLAKVLERCSRKGLEEAPSPGRSGNLEKARGPKAQKRLERGPEEAQKPRQDPQKARPRKGWEEAPKPSPERVLGVLRGLGEVLERFLKVLGRF